MEPKPLRSQAIASQGFKDLATGAVFFAAGVGNIPLFINNTAPKLERSLNTTDSAIAGMALTLLLITDGATCLVFPLIGVLKMGKGALSLAVAKGVSIVENYTRNYSRRSRRSPF